MPFNCGISVFEHFPIQAGGREAREYSTTTACKVTGCLLRGRDNDPAARGGGVVLTHRKILPVLQEHHENRSASCAQGPLGL